MHTDPVMPVIVFSVFLILIAGLFFKTIKQPSVVGYISAGVILGPFGLALLTDSSLISSLGETGIVLLMFFVGMEMCLSCLIAKWRVVIIGTILQIAASIAVVAVMGCYFDWTMNRIIFLGFVISLSSTAVVIKLLKDSNELDTDVGQSVVGVLLAQDIAVIVMILVLQLMGKPEIQLSSILKQFTGFVFFSFLIFFMSRKKEKTDFSYGKVFFSDPEYQVFAAILICFGGATLFSFLELSSALGAFASGIFLGSLKNTEWVHHNLSPFRVVFISLFFVSVGMQIDIYFLKSNWMEVGALVAGVLITNTFINGLIFKFLGMNWKESFYAGALLSQIGEFSFVLAAIGYNSGFISEYGFKLAMCTIAVSLILTVVWVRPVAGLKIKKQDA